MDTKFLPNDLDWFHCVRNHKTRKKEKKKDRKKERKKAKTSLRRPIIVKFVRLNVRHNIFENKKLLKGKGFSIIESLTKN